MNQLIIDVYQSCTARSATAVICIIAVPLVRSNCTASKCFVDAHGTAASTQLAACVHPRILFPCHILNGVSQGIRLTRTTCPSTAYIVEPRGLPATLVSGQFMALGCRAAPVEISQSMTLLTFVPKMLVLVSVHGGRLIQLPATGSVRASPAGLPRRALCACNRTQSNLQGSTSSCSRILGRIKQPAPCTILKRVQHSLYRIGCVMTGIHEHRLRVTSAIGPALERRLQ